MATNEKRVLFFVLLFVCGLLSGFFCFDYIYNNLNDFSKKREDSLSKESNFFVGYDGLMGQGQPCKRTSFSVSPDQFLKKYLVKIGDSFITIAEEQLKDLSRLNEIMELNKASTTAQLLLADQAILLPPLSVKTDGRLSSSSGKLVDRKDNILTINVGYTFDGLPTYERFYLKQENFVIDRDLLLGDCLDIVHSSYESSRDFRAIYAVYHQE